MNESSSCIPSIAMVSRFRGPATPLFLAGFFLIFLVSFLLIIPGGLPAPVEAQDDPCAGPGVCSPEVSASSRSPATGTRYEVTFRTPVAIQRFVGSIVMELHEDIRVPRGIAPNLVRLQITNEPNGPGCPESVRGTAAFVELTDQNDPRHPTIIRITHDLREDQTPAGICDNATVTVIFDKNAGISNPTEGGAFSWKVGVENDDNLVKAKHPEDNVIQAFKNASSEDADFGLLVDREIQLSHEEVSRGDSITVIARGFRTAIP